MRGRESEFIIARLYQKYGAPYAEAVPKFLAGRDVRKVPNIAPEVKSAKEFSPVAWLKQAKKNSQGDIPVVHYRPNGYGEMSAEEWPSIIRTGDLMRLFVAAGYLPGKRGPEPTYVILDEDMRSDDSYPNEAMDLF